MHAKSVHSNLLEVQVPQLLHVGHVNAIRGMHQLQAQLPLVVGCSVLVEQIYQGLRPLL